MAEPSSHINYSFEDIQRYLQGKMPAAEMHAIEKASLQDPFLADAIEGFHDTDLTMARQHLNEINASLFAEKQKTKVVAFNKRSQWLNIAALIIVLAGVGVVASYFLRSSNQQAKVAQVKNEPAKNEVAKDSTTGNIAPLSKKPDTSLFIAENKSLKKAKPLTLKKDVATDKIIEKDKGDVASVAAVPAQATQNTQSSMMDTVHFNMKTVKRNNDADSLLQALQGKVSGLALTPSTFSGKVVDQNGDPVPFATVNVKGTKVNVAADANANFSIAAKSGDVLTFSAVGLQSTDMTVESSPVLSVVMTRISTTMSDVVVTTALGIPGKSKALADSAMPVGGWKSFNNYVTEQLNKDTTAQSVTNADDMVEIEFLIDKMGNPYDLKVVKPLDDQHNAKAIDILKNGPKWTNASKKKKAKVAINF